MKTASTRTYAYWVKKILLFAGVGVMIFVGVPVLVYQSFAEAQQPNRTIKKAIQQPVTVDRDLEIRELNNYPQTILNGYPSEPPPGYQWQQQTFIMPRTSSMPGAVGPPNSGFKNLTQFQLVPVTQGTGGEIRPITVLGCSRSNCVQLQRRKETGKNWMSSEKSWTNHLFLSKKLKSNVWRSYWRKFLRRRRFLKNANRIKPRLSIDE